MASEINALKQNITTGTRVTPSQPAANAGSKEAPIASIKSTKELKNADLKRNQISVSDEQLIKAIEKAVKSMQGPYTYLEFSVHETTRRIAVTVHDRETGEVIREIPPEKTLDLVAKLWEMAGILVDERR